MRSIRGSLSNGQRKASLKEAPFWPKVFIVLAMTLFISVIVLVIYSPVSVIKGSDTNGIRGSGVVQSMVNSKINKASSLASHHGLDLPETSGHSDHFVASHEDKQDQVVDIAVNTTPPLSVVDRNEAVEKEMLRGIEAIRTMKGQKRVIETDPEAQAKIPDVQQLIRTFLINKYGPPPYKVRMDITLPTYLEAPHGGGQKAQLLIEMAPIEHVPYAVYFFLEHVVTGFRKGAFHRNAGHVLQAMIHRSEGLRHSNFAWQEYSPAFPHKKFTLGYAGRPSGSSAIYISTIDNTRNHGPASQGSKSEADVCWGRLADPASEAVVMVMQKQKGGSKGSGFITDSSNFVSIDAITIE